MNAHMPNGAAPAGYQQPPQHQQQAPQHHQQQPPQQQHQPNHAAPPPPMNYKKDGAAKADMGQRIDRTGQYIGALTKVKWHQYPSGAAGYVLDFKSSQGQEATGMFICTINKNGEPVEMGENKISALLCCLGVTHAAAATEAITEYNYETQMDEPVQVWMYRPLMNIPIGLVLQKELYTNSRTGNDAFRMSLIMAFQASSNRSAKEMIEGVQPADARAIADEVNGLGDKDTRSAPTGGSVGAQANYNGARAAQANTPQQQPSGMAGTAQAHGAAQPTPPGQQDFDDDIPF